MSHSKIDPNKKEILKCISKNGSYMSIPSDYSSDSKLYTIDIEKNIIYVGLREISAIHLTKYKNTNTIIFNTK